MDARNVVGAKGYTLDRHTHTPRVDVYSRTLKWVVAAVGWLARLMRVTDLDNDRLGGSVPVWSWQVGDRILESNITCRVDFALIMVEALENDELVHEAPAIVGRQTPSALAHGAG